MLHSRKGFVFGSLLVAIFLVIWTFKVSLEGGRLSLLPGGIILIYMVIHFFFFWIRIIAGKRKGWISFIPSLPSGIIMIILFYQWIKYKAYLGCPDGGICEDTLSPFLFITTGITLFCVIYSLIFELTLKYIPIDNQINNTPLPANPNEQDLTIETDQIGIPQKITNNRIFNRTNWIQVIIVIGGGLLSFGAVYLVYALIDFLIGWTGLNILPWILLLIYSFVLTILFLLSERTKWPSSVKAAMFTALIVIWIGTFEEIEFSSNNISHLVYFLSIAVPIGAIVYVFFLKKPWVYYIAIIFSVLLGFTLFN
ncbi:MAG: hypothetical protein KJ971_08080 [Firmicutes bacterium]|nr:hypothetical protein [Bacillota bacterium]